MMKVTRKQYTGPEFIFKVGFSEEQDCYKVTDDSGFAYYGGGFNSRCPVKEIAILPDFPIYWGLQEIYLDNPFNSVEIRTTLPIFDEWSGFTTPKKSLKSTIYLRTPLSDLVKYIPPTTVIFKGRVAFLDVNGNLVKDVYPLSNGQVF